MAGSTCNLQKPLIKGYWNRTANSVLEAAKWESPSCTTQQKRVSVWALLIQGEEEQTFDS